jgi:hypothetical protein
MQREREFHLIARGDLPRLVVDLVTKSGCVDDGE